MELKKEIERLSFILKPYSDRTRLVELEAVNAVIDEYNSIPIEPPVMLNFADIENIIANLRLKEYAEYLRNYETGKPKNLIVFSDGYKKALKDILAEVSKISA